MDLESENFMFWVNEDEVTFNVCKKMKHRSDIHVASTFDVIDETLSSMRHLIYMSEPLEVMLANYDESKIQGYEEVVVSFSVLGGYYNTPLKLQIERVLPQSL